MTAEGWRAALIEAFRRSLEGDQSLLDGLSLQLAEEDQAKQLLRNAGIVCVGKSLLDSVEEALRLMEYYGAIV